MISLWLMGFPMSLICMVPCQCKCQVWSAKVHVQLIVSNHGKVLQTHTNHLQIFTDHLLTTSPTLLTTILTTYSIQSTATNQILYHPHTGHTLDQPHTDQLYRPYTKQINLFTNCQDVQQVVQLYMYVTLIPKSREIKEDSMLASVNYISPTRDERLVQRKLLQQKTAK